MSEKKKFAFTFEAAEAATKSNSKPSPSYTAEERAALDKLAELDTQTRAIEAQNALAQARLAAQLRADLAPLLLKRAELVRNATAAVKPPAVSAFRTFWLTALRCHPLLALRMEEQDVGVLEHLIDVRCPFVGVTDQGDKRAGFAVTFVFSENKYFTNKELTKKFFYTPAPPGAILERTEGTEIDWKSPEVNATVSVVRRPVYGRGGRGRRGRGRGRKNNKGKPVRYEVVAEPRASFFRFFEDLENEDEELDSEEQEMLEGLEAEYFDVACIIRNNIYPHAIGWFTGVNITELPVELQQMALLGPDAFGDKPSFSEVMGGYCEEDLTPDETGTILASSSGAAVNDDDDNNTADDNGDGTEPSDASAPGKPVGETDKKPEECAKQQQ